MNVVKNVFYRSGILILLAMGFLLLLGVLAVFMLVLWHCFWVPGKEGAAVLLAITGLLLCSGVAAIIKALYKPLSRIRVSMKLLNESDTSGASIAELFRSRSHFENSFFDLIIKFQQQRENEYSLETLKKQAELNALQSQINPHFLYNTLDSIRGQLVAENLVDAAGIIESLSRLFRYSINPKVVYNTVEQELDNVDNYMRIIRYRFGERFVLQKKISAQSEAILNCEIPKLTLQPIVENAIQHGLEAKPDNGIITIRAFLSQNVLHISVEDNGVGVKASVLDDLNEKFRRGAAVQAKSGSGIALVNVNERVRLLYGEKYGLYVNSMEGMGTEVHILLPAAVAPLPNHKGNSMYHGGEKR